jgi:hypothetical protein
MPRRRSALQTEVSSCCEGSLDCFHITCAFMLSSSGKLYDIKLVLVQFMRIRNRKTPCSYGLPDCFNLMHTRSKIVVLALKMQLATSTLQAAVASLTWLP